MSADDDVPTCQLEVPGGKPAFTAGAFLSTLRRTAASLPTLLGAYLAPARLDATLREEVMVAVSRMNRCRHCTAIHSAWASLVGLTDEELARLEAMDPAEFDRRRWLAVQYGRCVAAGGALAAIEGELRALYTEAEIAQIAAVARAIDVANRLGNTWDSFEGRLLGKRDGSSDSTVLDELFVLGLVAPAGAPFLAVSKAIRLLRSEPTFPE